MGQITDVESVRQLLQKSTSDKFQDEDIEVLIGEAEEAIQRHCKREFTPTTGATRSFEWTPVEWYGVLDLAPYEIRSITSAVLDADLLESERTTLTTLQYRFRPYPAQDGTYFSLRLANLPVPRPSVSTVGTPSLLPFYTRRLDITGNWGMLTVPKDVQRAVNVTVESWLHLRRDPGIGVGETFSGEGPPMRGYDLPPGAFLALKRWMRPETVV